MSGWAIFNVVMLSLAAVAAAASGIAKARKNEAGGELLWNVSTSFVLLWVMIHVFAFTHGTTAAPATASEALAGRLVSEKRGAFYDVVLEAPESAIFNEWLDLAANDAVKLGRWMAEKPERGVAGDVAVTYRTNVSDRFGSINAMEVLTLRWKGEDWRRVQWQTVTPDLLVALASAPMMHTVIRDKVRSWCGAHRNLRWDPCDRL